MKVWIPPIKCQGIKSKLVPWIKQSVKWNGNGKWIEPFVGSGVVGFNMQPKTAIFCDTNPHIINFYNAINDNIITPIATKGFLMKSGEELSKSGKEFYYEVRERFNKNGEPLDFLFLNRSCFNGLIRFNGKGKFNTPYGHKPERFSKAYITKIVNQIDIVHKLTQVNDWTFLCQDFRKTLSGVTKDDFIYCDPPYIGRHVDYYNGWTDRDERELSKLLSSSSANFILSTWHSNQHRVNSYVDTLWSQFIILTREHFYHVGALETNRKPMLEALVLNYETTVVRERRGFDVEQMAMVDVMG